MLKKVPDQVVTKHYCPCVPLYALNVFYLHLHSVIFLVSLNLQIMDNDKSLRPEGKHQQTVLWLSGWLSVK